MKTNLNKLLTAIVLCTLFLVALPGTGIAAAQEDDPLDIYGNANEDDTIDMRDFTYTARMILWLEDETTLADANYDGDVNVLDMTQIGLIILGRESKLTLVDDFDRTVTVNKPIEKIVSGNVNNAEAIQLLKAEDRVVAVDVFTPTQEVLFPEFSELPAVADHYFWTDYEKIFELDADIFVTLPMAMPGFDDIVDTLEPEGIPVIALQFGPPLLAENIRKLRYILNTEEEGEEFIAFYEDVINPIVEKTAEIPEADKPEVFYEYFMDYYTWGKDAPEYSMQIEMAGGVNIAKDQPGAWIEVSKEWVMDQNPDVIVSHPGITPGCSHGYEEDDPADLQAVWGAIMDRDELAVVDAVTDERVYVSHFAWCFSPRYIVSVAYMAKWFHPELFSELDPNAIHQEYLTDFMRIDYDLDEHGVFVYHPVEHPDGK